METGPAVAWCYPLTNTPTRAGVDCRTPSVLTEMQ